MLNNQPKKSSNLSIFNLAGPKFLHSSNEQFIYQGNITVLVSHAIKSLGQEMTFWKKWDFYCENILYKSILKQPIFNFGSKMPLSPFLSPFNDNLGFFYWYFLKKIKKIQWSIEHEENIFFAFFLLWNPP